VPTIPTSSRWGFPLLANGLSAIGEQFTSDIVHTRAYTC
jgi:hypothetical protein